MPIGVDWPEEMYLSQERVWSFEIGGETFGIGNVSIGLDPIQWTVSL